MKRTSQGIVIRLESKSPRAGTHRHTHTFSLQAKRMCWCCQWTLTSKPMPRQSKQTWHRSPGQATSVMLLQEGPCSPPGTYVQPQFVLLIYAVLCYRSSAAIHNWLCITIQITSDWSWHNNRAGVGILLQLQGRRKAEETGLCWSLVSSPLDALRSHNPPSKSGCVSYAIVLHIHKLILKAAFRKQLVVMCD